jgi:hypothetical protein
MVRIKKFKIHMHLKYIYIDLITEFYAIMLSSIRDRTL